MRASGQLAQLSEQYFGADVISEQPLYCLLPAMAFLPLRASAWQQRKGSGEPSPI